jgi:hypothetical protein
MTSTLGTLSLDGEVSTVITNCEVVVFKVRREANGLFTGTSPQLSGVFVTHRDLEKIVEDMPNIIRLWFKRHRNAAVEVLTSAVSHTDNESVYLAGTVPAEIAAQALAS